MKTTSNIKPQEPFIIEQVNSNHCDVVFFVNIEEIHCQNETSQVETLYEYDLYRLSCPFRETLSDDITNNYDVWLECAKESEKIVKKDPSDKELIDALQEKNSMLEEALLELASIIGGE